LTDPRFADIRTRGQPDNMKAIDGIIAAWTRTLDTPALAQVLQRAEVPSSPTYTIADIYQDPHYAARQMLVKVPHPALGHTTQAGVVPKLSATPGAIRHTGPEIGADTAEALRGIGLGESQIQELEAAKVIRART
jgi:crotonobetainyl-CoA:carnitine CoA-transferase CaiB-like acyl-CoA transferase